MVRYVTRRFAGSRGPRQWLAELVQRAVSCEAAILGTPIPNVSPQCVKSHPELGQINWYWDMLHITAGFGQPGKEGFRFSSTKQKQINAFFYIRDWIIQMAHRQLPGKWSKDMVTTSQYLQRTFCHWSHTYKFYESQIKDAHYSESPTELDI